MTAVALGAGLGVLVWFGFSAALGPLPAWLRFLVSALIFTFGPGASATARLLRDHSLFSRIVLALSAGVAFSPVLGHLLGIVGGIAAYPYVCAALSGGVLAYWRRQGGAFPSVGARTRLAALVLIVIALTMGAIAFANRLTTDGGATTVYGDYDSYDLTYYAEIAAELSHTVPPASPFFTGRMLNHAFYPHVLLAMIHRFAGVPLLEIYFGLAWPSFLVLVALVCFVFIESISTTRAAFLTALLLMVGGNFAYLAKWLLKPALWDDVIWSHNFQGATAEPLLYNNWTPALIAMFAALYGLQRSTRGWALLAGAVLATTILAKPWVFASVCAALVMAAFFARRDAAARTPLLIALGTAIVFGAPLLYRTVTLFEDSQVVFEPAFFPIPLVMTSRLGLREWFLERAAAFGLSGSTQVGVASLMAAPLFLLGSLGYRLVGVRALWRSLFRADTAPVWRVMAWTAAAALGASTFIVSVPYHEITQVNQFVMFMMTMFAAKSVASWANARVRPVVTAAIIVIAIPCTIAFLHRKWTDSGRPLVSAGQGELRAASLLADTDPERTVVLHDRPNDAFLVGILAARRSAVAWAGYVRGSEARRADAEAFFASPDLPAAEAALRSMRPTHVLEHEDRDHMNPDIRARLEFVSRNEGVVLYRVPEQLLR